jgi:hypothetical protein
MGLINIKTAAGQSNYFLRTFFGQFATAMPVENLLYAC